VRTFVALNLPREEQARLHGSLERLRAKSLPVRWVAPEGLHMTVRFLGETEGEAVTPVDEVLRTAAARRAPVTLRVGGLGAFPSLRRATILWVGIAQDSELAALHRELEPALSRLGFPREQRPFRPHITIGRVRGSAKALDVERLTGLVDYEATITVETVDLMQSISGPGGSRHERLLSRQLGAQEDM
jgi:2'-5' RNA ligase